MFPGVAGRVTIDRRFNGPPDSANGGYACGVVAGPIAGPAEVTLRRPPPLDAEMELVRDGERVTMLHDGALVAEAEPVDGGWDVPDPVSVEAARAAGERSPWTRHHPFPTCFGCGPERGDDALHCLAGPVEGRELSAVAWMPPAGLADGDGRVPPEVVWAALDCPSSAPVANPPGPDGELRPVVLGRLAVELRGPVEAGRAHVVTAWTVAVDGRKRYAGSALFKAGGELLASAQALWIELKAG
jgi:hypothetical protein